MIAQCTEHAQLESIYGVSRVTCHHEPGTPISISKIKGPGVKTSHLHIGVNCFTPYVHGNINLYFAEKNSRL